MTRGAARGLTLGILATLFIAGLACLALPLAALLWVALLTLMYGSTK